MRTRAIPERFCGGDSLRRSAISSVCTFTFTKVKVKVHTLDIALLHLYMIWFNILVLLCYSVVALIAGGCFLELNTHDSVL